MKRLLVLFTKGFPYNISEPFLENEYPLYKEYFHKVLIVTGCKKTEKPTRNITDPTIEIIKDYTLSKDIRSIAEAIPSLITDKDYYKELWRLIKKKQLSLKRFYDMTVAALCGNHRANIARKWIKKHPEYEPCAIYSFWMNIPAYGALKLKKLLGNEDLRVVARVNGFDVYEERYKTKYIPYQEMVVKNLTHIASTSEDWKRYLEKKYGSEEKITVHYLGSSYHDKINPTKEREIFNLVSCARVVSVKRLERIVDALSLITDRKIKWTHFGGGELLDSLKEYATKKLSDNIETDFRGTIPNTQIYKEYQEKSYHAFISVSWSEGTPVSISEAISFGIPVIATSVGGQPELVDDGKNGFLIDRDFEDSELVQAILKMADMPENEYLEFRTAARAQFERKFNAERNNRTFIEEVLNVKKI